MLTLIVEFSDNTTHKISELLPSFMDYTSILV